MTERKETLSPRTEAAKQFALEKRDLSAKESEAERLLSSAAKTAKLRKLRLAKEAAEREAATTAGLAKRPRK
jgi:hypothetical protein